MNLQTSPRLQRGRPMSSPGLVRARLMRPGHNYRSRRNQLAITSEDARARSIERRVVLAWWLLLLNTLTYTGSAIHIPSFAGKCITQGALPIAIIVALSVNRRVVVRPNVFLCLVTLLVFGAMVTALEPKHLGTVYRTFRLAEFVAALWLLTPWWGRRDLLLIRSYLTALLAVLGTVYLGFLISPGRAFGGGRLSGVLWDIPPTQVAHYAAVALGVYVVLWLGRQARGKATIGVIAVAGTALVLTHTRTALVGFIAGLLVAGVSLMSTHARARRVLVVASVVVMIAIMTASSLITTWASRGEGAKQLGNLTGRTLVWGPLLSFPRDGFQEVFGFGLSNSSFNGLAIDSNWLSSYQEQGLFGVGVCVAILAFLLVAAYFCRARIPRAIALFLTTYCLVASFTEDGFTDATPYLLELTLAASVLVASGWLASGERSLWDPAVLSQLLRRRATRSPTSSEELNGQPRSSPRPHGV